MTEPLLSLRNITKSFGTVDALLGVDVDVYPGEVLCVLGDNGAGKSTLIKVMAGFHKQTSGVMEVGGQEVDFKNPRDAAEFGIATVHQFGGTFPLMTIGRSFFVGSEPYKWAGPFKRFDRKTANEVAIREIRGLGITRINDASRLVGALSGGERQSLAIARAIYRGANILILDEPTAALGVKEAAHVLRIIMEARERGVAVILVTHNVAHALTVGDHFVVLIHGEVADDFLEGERTREQVTDLMAGGEAMADLEAELAAYRAARKRTRRVRPSD